MKKKKELIKIAIDNSNRQTILGRHLYKILKIKEKYTDWFKRLLEYGFEQDIDYCLVSEKSEIKHELSTSKRTRINHQLTLDMAKEICMIQRTEIGRETRKYFIKCEKQLKQVISMQKDPERKKIRQEGKIIHKEQTDAVKIYIDYSISNGSKNYAKKPRNAYTNIANAINRALFIFTCKPSNVRDYLSKRQLANCKFADTIVAKTIFDEIEKETHYKTIYQIVKVNLETFGKLIGKTQVIE